MINIALIPLEKAINQALKTDPETYKRLNTLSDKIIKLEITDWRLHLFVLPHLNHIELQANYTKTPNTVIRGRLNDVMRIGLAKDKQAAIQQHKISFEGDADVGMTLQRIFTQLNIDWEQYLTDTIGDTPGHFVSKAFRTANELGGKILASLRDNTKDAIFHEQQLFPTKAELTAFYQDIAILRNDVDRLAARIQHLKQKRQTS